MRTVDITIQKNTEKRIFSKAGISFCPIYIGVAHTKKGVSFEHSFGSPDVELGKEFPRSSKGYNSYKSLNDPFYSQFVRIPKGLIINLCGKILVVNE